MIGDFRNCWHVENATSAPLPAAAEILPTRPGQVMRRGDQVILHYGPDRWLCLDNNARQIDELHAMASGSAVEITDVSGYWAKFTFGDGIGFSDLAASQPVELFLKDRDCAVMSLFDCPAIAVNGADLTMLLVRSSYAESFAQTLAKARSASLSPSLPR